MPSTAAVMVGWTMPNAFTGSPTGLSYIPYGSGTADQGDQTAGSQIRSVHASASTAYTSPAGNGSAYSFSSNYWGAGDFYEISFNASNYVGMTLSWDQARSGTGPSSFVVSMSVNGGVFQNLYSYSVLQSGGTGAPGTWSTTTSLSAYSFSGVALNGADNAGSVVVRFVSQVAGSATAGTNRIDNIFVNGSLLPAPGAVALVGIAALVAGRRRR
jgi:hypothetical protein